MTETSKVYRVELLTPCFCKGSSTPEIRGTSIRGMIREWKRFLVGNPDNIWGGRGGNSSKVAVTVSNITDMKEGKEFILPHKGGTQQNSIFENTKFSLTLNRLVGCGDSMWQEAKQDVENWLILGCLGQRANRAAGSVWCNDLSLVDIKVNSCDIRVSKQSFSSGLEARETTSDTVNNLTYFGSFNPRTPSPTKMKVIKIEGKFHILLFAKDSNILDGALNELKNKHNPIRWRNLDFKKIDTRSI